MGEGKEFIAYPQYRMPSRFGAEVYYCSREISLSLGGVWVYVV